MGGRPDITITSYEKQVTLAVVLLEVIHTYPVTIVYDWQLYPKSIPFP